MRSTSNKRKVIVGAAILVLGAIAVPPMIAALDSDPGRTLDGVTLEGVSYDDVSFHNEEQDVDLAGMLLSAEGNGPHPAAVIIHGSGTSSRDNRWYLTLADHLQRSGVTVLLPDKRGSESSDGDWQSASYADLATDTTAAVEYLRTRSDIDSEAIGVIGMSQGGQIAPVVASTGDGVSWVVNVAGSSLPAKDTLRFEEKNNLRAMGFLPGVSDVIAYPSSWSLTEWRDSSFWDAVGDFDPLPFWADTDQPTLVVYGSIDANVPTAASAERLEELGRPNMTIEVYEGSGHAIQDPEGEGNGIFREDALASISGFITDNS